MSRHYESYGKYLKTGKGYITSFEILKENNCMIGLLDRYPCKTRDELLARERYWIEKTDCVNKCIPTRTKTEYKRDNCEKTREQNQKYFENPLNVAKAKKSKQKYEASDKYKLNKAYRNRMTREWGDRYCNSLTRICWDVFL